MIEVSLVPDIKRELLKARRIRNFITFIVVIVTASAVGITIILASTVYIGQAVALNSLHDEAKREYDDLLVQHPGINNALTIQSQLSQISSINSGRYLPSRLFGILDAVLPRGDNQVTISELNFEKASNTLKISAQTKADYVGLDAFIKTIGRTQYAFINPSFIGEPPMNGCRQANLSDESKIPDDVKERCSKGMILVGDVQSGDSSYGRASDGGMVLRFEITFTVPEEVLAFGTRGLVISGPTRQNVTDSFTQIPTDMFEERAPDIMEDE
jgi:hypothetical protein